MTADEMIERLGLRPHPEGGLYDELRAAAATAGARPDWTAIHFLPREGERSHRHRVDAEETWLHLAGAPLVRRRSAEADGPAEAVTFGPMPGMGRMAVVAPEARQSARCTGDGTLVACTVTPGSGFEGFTLAPADIDIPDAIEPAPDLPARTD